MRTRGGKVGSKNTFGTVSRPARVTLPHIPSSTFGEPSPPLQTPTTLPTIVQDPSSQTHCPSLNESQPHSPAPNSESISDASRIDPIHTKKLIKPDGDSFDPVVDVVRDISEVIKSKFETSSCTWRGVEPELKQLWWREWSKNYRWIPEHQHLIEKNWKGKAAKAYVTMMHSVRENLKKGKRPIWIKEESLAIMIEKWDSNEYKEKKEQAKKNRASSKGGTINTGGSIPFSEHRRRLAKETGSNSEPILANTFLRTHKRKDTGKFVDHRASKAYAGYIRVRSIRISQEDSSDVVDEVARDNACWIEAVGGMNRKGQIFGVGSQKNTIQSSSSSRISHQSSLPSKFQQDLEHRLSSLQMELVKKDELLAKKDELLAKKDELIQVVLKDYEARFQDLYSKLNVHPTPINPNDEKQ